MPKTTSSTKDFNSCGRYEHEDTSEHCRYLTNQSSRVSFCNVSANVYLEMVSEHLHIWMGGWWALHKTIFSHEFNLYMVQKSMCVNLLDASCIHERTGNQILIRLQYSETAKYRKIP